MPQALQRGVPSSASLHRGVLFTLHDAHVFAVAEAGLTTAENNKEIAFTLYITRSQRRGTSCPVFWRQDRLSFFNCHAWHYSFLSLPFFHFSRLDPFPYLLASPFPSCREAPRNKLGSLGELLASQWPVESYS